ncbi:hypothetical protein EJB05_33102, partial [Eragrostis curvula]
MMMMGEGAHAPPWQNGPACCGVEDPDDAYTLLAALRQYLPSNEASAAAYNDAGDDDDEDTFAALDAYASCDEFRMYEFKVRRCARGARTHDWTDCPFVHPGEKARRRDPRRYTYSGAACPEFRRGGCCKRGDACEFAHGVFECWLHPARYRTQLCKDGTACRRRVCFFAHTPDQLRAPPPQQKQSRAGLSPLAESYDGSPLRRQAFESSYLTKSAVSSSPISTLVSPPESPPMSPNAAGAFHRGSWPGVGSPVDDVLASLHQLRLGSSPKSAPSSTSFLAGYTSGGAFGSPKSTASLYSLPSTPTVTVTTSSGATIIERVDSGRSIREKVFERLCKEATVPNAAAAAAENAIPAIAPDVGWVTDLIN